MCIRIYTRMEMSASLRTTAIPDPIITTGNCLIKIIMHGNRTRNQIRPSGTKIAYDTKTSRLDTESILRNEFSRQVGRKRYYYTFAYCSAIAQLGCETFLIKQECTSNNSPVNAVARQKGSTLERGCVTMSCWSYDGEWRKKKETSAMVMATRDTRLLIFKPLK